MPPDRSMLVSTAAFSSKQWVKWLFSAGETYRFFAVLTFIHACVMRDATAGLSAGSHRSEDSTVLGFLVTCE